MSVPLWLCLLILLLAIGMSWPNFDLAWQAVLTGTALFLASYFRYMGSADSIIITAIALLLPFANFTEFLYLLGLIGFIFGLFYRKITQHKEFPLIVPLSIALIATIWVGKIWL